MKNIKTRWNRGKYEIPFKKISIYLDTGGKVFFWSGSVLNRPTSWQVLIEMRQKFIRMSKKNFPYRYDFEWILEEKELSRMLPTRNCWFLENFRSIFFSAIFIKIHLSKRATNYFLLLLMSCTYKNKKYHLSSETRVKSKFLRFLWRITSTKSPLMLGFKAIFIPIFKVKTLKTTSPCWLG